jgi:hypothetical protein
MRYILAVNRTIRGKLAKDASSAQWAAFNDGFENVELTAGQIAAEIRAGHAIAPQHNGRRKAAHWTRAQHIGIDLDNGAIEWDALIALPLVQDHAAIVHTTASHRPDNPRYRVLFLLEQPLTNPAGYRHVVECLLRAFDTADPHCRDASRLFFGAPGCSLLLQDGNVLTSEDIANVVTAWPDLPAAGAVDAPPDLPPPPPSTAPHDAPHGAAHGAGGDIVPPDRLSPRRLDAHRAALLDRIATAPDGAKWATLRDTAITMGGYAAAGYYSPDEARRWLRAAIEARRATVASMAAAYQTIDQGLTYGQLSPLYYLRGDDDRAPVAAAGAPPVESLAALRWRVYSGRLAELEGLIAAAPDGAPDFAEWVAEYADIRRALDLLVPDNAEVYA